MIWREKGSRIRAVQMDNLRGLLEIRRMDKVPNTWIRQLCGVKKGVEEKIDEGLLRESMNRNVLAVPQWVGRGRGELIP